MAVLCICSCLIAGVHSVPRNTGVLASGRYLKLGLAATAIFIHPLEVSVSAAA